MNESWIPFYYNIRNINYRQMRAYALYGISLYSPSLVLSLLSIFISLSFSLCFSLSLFHSRIITHLTWVIKYDSESHFFCHATHAHRARYSHVMRHYYLALDVKHEISCIAKCGRTNVGILNFYFFDMKRVLSCCHR